MPPILISQGFSQGEVPPDARQKNRLLAALTWNFEFTFMYTLPDTPRTTALYNSGLETAEPQPDEFTITSAAEGGTVTLTAVRLGNTRPMTMIEILPADNSEVEEIVLEPDRRVIRFKYEDDLLKLNVKISGLNILNLRSAAGRIEVEDLPPSQSSGEILPFLQREEVFHFDELTNKRDLESPIAELFSLFFEGAGNIEFGVACAYSYSLGPSLPEVSVPVMLLSPANSADHKDIATNLAVEIKRWWANSAPAAGGMFNFEISAYSTAAADRRKIFRFSRLVLPSAAPSDLPAA